MIPFSNLASGIYMMYFRPDCSYSKHSANWKLRKTGEERKEHSLINRRRKKINNSRIAKALAVMCVFIQLLLFSLSLSVASLSHCISDVSENTAAVFLLYHPTALLLHGDPDSGSVSALKVQEVSGTRYRLLTGLIVSFILSILTSS